MLRFRATSQQDSNHFEYKIGIKNPLFSGFCTEIAGPGLEPINFESGSSYDPFLEDS